MTHRRDVAARITTGGGIGMAGIGAVGALAFGLLKAQEWAAHRHVGGVLRGAPDDSGEHGAGPGRPIALLVVGDSLAAGMGALDAGQTIGASLARSISIDTGRSVRVTNVARVGATSPQLAEQVAFGLELVPTPDVAIVIIGANDIVKRTRTTLALRCLEEAVTTLRQAGADVVVGTCPDLGAVQSVAQPLRSIVARRSRDLAVAQARTVAGAGGRVVDLGTRLRGDFASQPELFSQDRYHPSAAGYARAADVLYPDVLACLHTHAATKTTKSA